MYNAIDGIMLEIDGIMLKIGGIMLKTDGIMLEGYIALCSLLCALRLEGYIAICSLLSALCCSLEYDIMLHGAWSINLSCMKPERAVTGLHQF